MNKVSGTLEVAAPFNLYRSARFLEMFRPMKDEQQVADSNIEKAIMVHGQTILFKIKQDGKLDDDPVRYELMSPEPLDPPVCENAANRISFFLSLKEDVKPFYEIAQKEDPKFYPLSSDSGAFTTSSFQVFLR